MQRKSAKRDDSRIAPATLAEVIDLARRLDGLTSDDQWTIDNDARNALSGILNDLQMAIIFLPKRIGDDLVHRLARAEAERVRASVLILERRLRATLAEDDQLEAALDAADHANASVCAFLVMVDGLDFGEPITPLKQ